MTRDHLGTNDTPGRCEPRGQRRIPSWLAGVARKLLPTLLLLPSLAWTAPFAYITNTGDDTVSVIDTASNTVVATVGVGNGLWVPNIHAAFGR